MHLDYFLHHQIINININIILKKTFDEEINNNIVLFKKNIVIYIWV